jgi:hypothetical protein
LLQVNNNCKAQLPLLSKIIFQREGQAVILGTHPDEQPSESIVKVCNHLAITFRDIEIRVDEAFYFKMAFQSMIDSGLKKQIKIKH